MTSPFVAEIRIFAGTFAPTGWALCNGQLMPISQNTAMFSLLGTVYGGNGSTTFALPDLVARAPLHCGQGTGLSNRMLGESAGSATVTLVTSELPSHSHSLSANAERATTSQPTNNVLAVSRLGDKQYTTDAPGDGMGVQAMTMSGADLPHNNLPPYQVLTFIIAQQGVFPPRP